MRLSYCTLPLARLPRTVDCASNDYSLNAMPTSQMDVSATSNVRLLRRAKDTDSARFVLSGKLADVCAALDVLAAEENRKSRRVAMQ